MLVEGGYLDAMKKVIEKASQTPDIGGPPRGGGVPPRPAKGPGVLAKSLRRLRIILLGREMES